MMRTRASVVTMLWMLCAALGAQTVRPVPRPPAPTPGAPPDGSAAPDGYAPIPEWLGQTRAPRPAPGKTAAFDVETVAEGFNGAFCFSFLPDGRMLVGERPGHIKIVGKDGKSAEVEGLPANLYARQGLFEVRADRAFATNRVVYLTYLVLPDGVNPATVRSPGVLVAASAKLSA